MIRGRQKYVPPNILEELKSIRLEEGITRDADAFRKMVEYSRVGREVKKMRDKFFMKDIFKY